MNSKACAGHMPRWNEQRVNGRTWFDVQAKRYYQDGKSTTTRAKSSTAASRVHRLSKDVEQTLERAKEGGSLASYDLQSRLSIGRTVRNLKDHEGSSSSSESSSDSSDDNFAETMIRDRRERASSVAQQQKEGIGIRQAPHGVSCSEVVVCMGKACRKKGAGAVLSALQNSPGSAAGTINCRTCKCLKQCKRGPALEVQLPTGETRTYVGVSADTAPHIVGSFALKTNEST